MTNEEWVEWEEKFTAKYGWEGGLRLMLTRANRFFDSIGLQWHPATGWDRQYYELTAAEDEELRKHFRNRQSQPLRKPEKPSPGGPIMKREQQMEIMP